MAKGKNAISTVRKFFPRVLDVIDAVENLEIEVKNRDCNSASVKNHNSCAMAQACKRQLHLDGAIISVGTAYMVKGTTATRYRISERISREIVAFDRNGGFMPGKYKLNKPWTGHLLGARRGSDKVSDGKTPKRHRGPNRHFTGGIRAILNSAQPAQASA